MILANGVADEVAEKWAHTWAEGGMKWRSDPDPVTAMTEIIEELLRHCEGKDRTLVDEGDSYSTETGGVRVTQELESGAVTTSILLPVWHSFDQQ